MRRTWSYPMILALVLYACSSAPPPEAPPVPELSWDQVDQADGATLYCNLCASCHGEGARGDGPLTADLAVDMPDLRRLTERNNGKFPLQWIEKTIYGPDTLEIHGGPQMPVWGPALMGVFDSLPNVNREAFAANRIRRLARYLESLQIEGE